MSRHRLAATALVAGLTALLTSTIVQNAHADDVGERGYRPNKPLIVSGFVTFGIPYTIWVSPWASGTGGGLTAIGHF